MTDDDDDDDALPNAQACGSGIGSCRGSDSCDDIEGDWNELIDCNDLEYYNFANGRGNASDTFAYGFGFGDGEGSSIRDCAVEG